LTEIIF